MLRVTTSWSVNWNHFLFRIAQLLGLFGRAKLSIWHRKMPMFLEICGLSERDLFVACDLFKLTVLILYNICNCKSYIYHVYI